MVWEGCRMENVDTEILPRTQDKSNLGQTCMKIFKMYKIYKVEHICYSDFSSKKIYNKGKSVVECKM